MELNMIVLLGLALAVISVLSLIIEQLFFPSILSKYSRFYRHRRRRRFLLERKRGLYNRRRNRDYPLFFLLGLKFPLGELMKRLNRVWKAGVLDIVLAFGVTIGIAMLF